MAKKKRRLEKKPYRTKDTFKKTWSLVLYDEETNDNSDLILRRTQKDLYFEEVPKSQDFLTDTFRVIHKKIEYSNFVQLPYYQISINNLYDCFHGILFYIYYYSENKFNVEELEFHYSGGMERANLNKTILANRATTNKDYFNILSIFDYENAHSQFKINSYHNSFFGVTFKRITIQPMAYSIRTGENQNIIASLTSFTFEAFDEENNQWDILDERVNVNDLIRGGDYKMYFTRSVTKSYSSFKIRQIEPGHNGFWGFSIAAFDIHGIVNAKNEANDNLQIQNYLDMSSESFGSFSNFNPSMDMSDLI